MRHAPTRRAKESQALLLASNPLSLRQKHNKLLPPSLLPRQRLPLPSICRFIHHSTGYHPTGSLQRAPWCLQIQPYGLLHLFTIFGNHHRDATGSNGGMPQPPPPPSHQHQGRHCPLQPSHRCRGFVLDEALHRGRSIPAPMEARIGAALHSRVLPIRGRSDGSHHLWRSHSLIL